jgi:hypothetical protein
MNTIIDGAPWHVYGDAEAGAASAQGISFEAAAYQTAHDYPGGVPALALRMGRNANTLQHKVDPLNTTHQLTVREAREMMAFTGDYRMLQAMAAELGHVMLSLRFDPAGCTLGDLAGVAKEFGELLQAVHDAVADGKVTTNEIRAVERQFAELIAKGNNLLATLRGMQPRAPG